MCKRLQWYNRHTCGGAAKGSRGGWYRRWCVLRHPHRTPWVPSGIGQRCSLGYWQNRLWARVRKQGVAHCRPMDLRTRRKRKLLFLCESGYRWRNGNKMKRKILLPALHRGKERRCSRRLLRKSKFQHLQGCPRQGRFVDYLDDLGPGWDAGGAALLREARRAGLGVDSTWGGAALEDAEGAHGQTGPGGSGGWCITPGQDVLNCLGLLLYHRELLGRMLDGVAEQPCLGDGASRKRALSTSFISARLR